MVGRPFVRFAGRTPKWGNLLDECEDHVAVSASRFAVADGASEASYSQRWAHLLTAAFCQHDGSDSTAPDGWLTTCRGQWHQWELELTERDLPWFTREKLRAGSFATFVGLEFADNTDARAWDATACGDACLFMVRDDALALAFPLTTADAFDSRPHLLPTSTDATSGDLHVMGGSAQIADRYYLTTDALAQWFLAECERGGRPWVAFDTITTAAQLEELVSAWRESGALKNDDVALIAVEIVPA